jgi:carbonic anhydrase
MSIVAQILQHNQTFVEDRSYEAFRTTVFPDKKLVVLTCMDTRLVELLPRAMNLKNGDAKIIKNAGAIVSHPFGSVMRSILVAVYQLNAEEVIVVGHHGCGMTGMSGARLLEKVRNRNVPEITLDILRNAGIDLDRWLKGFDTVEQGVRESVEIVRNHPLLPRDVRVHGMIMCPDTGKLDVLVDGYAEPSRP